MATEFPFVFLTGKVCYFMTDGNAYHDFFSGIAVSALGHSHPALVDAICEQARNLYIAQVCTI